MKDYKLSERQLEVMFQLWQKETGTTASDIAKKTGLNINTVQAALRALINKKYIEVGSVVYSNTVLARSYVPIIEQDEYAIEIIRKGIDILKGSSDGMENVETLATLERIVNEQIREINIRNKNFKEEKRQKEKSPA